VLLAAPLAQGPVTLQLVEDKVEPSPPPLGFVYTPLMGGSIALRFWAQRCGSVVSDLWLEMGFRVLGLRIRE